MKYMENKSILDFRPRKRKIPLIFNHEKTKISLIFDHEKQRNALGDIKPYKIFVSDRL